MLLSNGLPYLFPSQTPSMWNFYELSRAGLPMTWTLLNGGQPHSEENNIIYMLA